jgi:phosphoribosylformylglycinamidine cyclo-ligase
VIKGIAAGCEQAGCALIGGETASIPARSSPANTTSPDSRRRGREIEGDRRHAHSRGDALLGLASSGPHSNGFSLIPQDPRGRAARISGESYPGAPAAHTLGEALLEPTRIYVKAVLDLLQRVDVKGMAHITGGGLSRTRTGCFPAIAQRISSARRWPRPAIFDWLQRAGNVADAEMHRVFNCGIGMIVVVAAADADEAIAGCGRKASASSAWARSFRARPGAPATVVA